ncbi:glycoprotein-N-acetylgalactosamine 3-beta-galactosyltransferase 1-like isoform X2 [Physella acuta]|uniref:glycoprotein-N-acetylgalactosamine 3-beta-galactosyltransferase 1-like isoform X2 n=1 Tax=Physella acuta TaxID=109671 RepID=UPI0027DAF017|nr:glycoprotein-N-acetylgalactosamine 3-beta-galactosyltransferase 1-like isoform X2 [Physella acuta]
MQVKTFIVAFTSGYTACCVSFIVFFGGSHLSRDTARVLTANFDVINGTRQHGVDDVSLADLRKQVKVLIWVMTSPSTLNTRAEVVKKTWATHAEKVLYMSSQSNSSFPAIGLNVTEGRDQLSVKTMEAFSYVYRHHFQQFDWFMKADDDTYVIVENLLFFLSDKDCNDPVYFGNIYKVKVKQGYNSGGAGYVLSKEALRRLCLHGDAQKCRQEGREEDVAMGECLQRLGVRAGETVDSQGRTRFHPNYPEYHLVPYYPPAYSLYDLYNGYKMDERLRCELPLH